MRLLGAEHEAGRPEPVDRRADPLEAHEFGVVHGHAVGLGDATHEAARDERRHDEVARAGLAARRPPGDRLVAEQGAELVARERGPGRPRRPGERRRGAEPVAVRVAREHEVVASGTRLVDRPGEHGRILGVRHMSGHVGKVAVGLLVGAIDPQPLEARAAEHGHHGARAHAVQGRVKNGQVARPRCGLLQDRGHELAVHRRLDELHATVGHGGVETLAPHLIHVHHAVDDPLVVWRQHLHAAGPVDLYGVVARGIVARGDHDPAGALRLAHSEREFGRAAKAA